MKWQRDLVLISKNQKSADLVIINGRLVNVSTKEVYPADVASEKIVTKYFKS